ncbi:unnamed protein product [Discula destructiva]
MRITQPRAGRWLLLSDIHFRAHDLDRIQRTAQWIEKLPKAHDVSRVVICGDLLSSRTNQPTHVLSACYRFLSNLIDAVPRVNILLGNHDLAHKRDYATTALDALTVRRLAPFVELHSRVSSHEWDGRRVLMLPFREDQTELTSAVSRLKPRDAAETVAFAHLAIHKAVTQRHIVRPSTGDSVMRPITHRGMTGPGNFASLARTFTGHFHSHQTMIQHGEAQIADRLRGSLTYIGSPLQLTWADLNDEQRGVVLLDPVTLQHELLVNPHAVDFITADLEKTLRDELDGNSIVGKHVMLVGQLTQFKYVTARDRLLTLGARSVRNWSPMSPTLQQNERMNIHGLGASVPMSDYSLNERLPRSVDATVVEAANDQTVDSGEVGSKENSDSGKAQALQEPKPDAKVAPQVHPLDLERLAKEYVAALQLDPSLAERTDELTSIGLRLLQTSITDENAPLPSYQDILQAAQSPGRRLLSASSDDAEAKQIFDAQPRTLTMANFLGIQETISISFIDLPRGLAFIVGTNGSGKSTLLEAMTWCQFGRCVRNGLAVNDVVNDVTGKNCGVSLEFDNGYTISRYRKHKEYGNRVIVAIHGEEQTHLEKDDPRTTQAAIDELLGIDYDTYIRTIVLGNESTAGFLSSTALQRRELIESLLGLSVLDEHFDLAKQMVKDVDEEISELQSQRDGLSQTITHIQGRMAELKRRRKQAQKEATGASAALEVALEDKSGIEDEKKAFMDKMLENEAASNQALAELQDQVNEARRVVDNLRAAAHTADLRISFDTEQSVARNKLYDSQRRLQDLSLAFARIEAPSSLRWRLINGTNQALTRLQQWLRHRIYDEAESRPVIRRFAISFSRALNYTMKAFQNLEANLAESKQQAAADQLRIDITAATRELDKLKAGSEHISERVALARGIGQQEMLQSIKDMAIDEAREIAKQHTAAENRLSLLMAKSNQAMQQRMHKERRDRSQRDELGTKLAELEHNVTLLHNSLANNESQAATYTQLLDREQASIKKLQQQRAACDEQIEELASSRELFAFWETSLSRRHSKGTKSSTATTFRAYVMSQSLDELNNVLSQILTLLYDDTRHARAMTSGMLRSLYQDDEDQASALSSGQATKGVVLDKTLGINSALSYAKRSGGERKRIDLALFFSLLHLSLSRSRHRARYLLVDEVFDGLDAAGQAVVVRWCRSSMARLDFVLVITHSEHMIRDGEGGEGCLRIEAKMGDGGTYFDFDG